VLYRFYETQYFVLRNYYETQYFVLCNSYEMPSIVRYESEKKRYFGSSTYLVILVFRCNAFLLSMLFPAY